MWMLTLKAKASFGKRPQVAMRHRQRKSVGLAVCLVPIWLAQSRSRPAGMIEYYRCRTGLSLPRASGDDHSLQRSALATGEGKAGGR